MCTYVYVKRGCPMQNSIQRQHVRSGGGVCPNKLAVSGIHPNLGLGPKQADGDNCTGNRCGFLHDKVTSRLCDFPWLSRPRQKRLHSTMPGCPTSCLWFFHCFSSRLVPRCSAVTAVPGPPILAMIQKRSNTVYFCSILVRALINFFNYTSATSFFINPATVYNAFS